MKEIKLTQNKVAMVDDDDFEYLNQFKWTYYKSGHGYAGRRGKNNESILMHRDIMNVLNKNNTLIDHIDGNGLNNQKSNLRLANKSQNAFNRKKTSKNTSGYKGVTWSKYANSWFVSITVNKRKIYLGNFKVIEDAAKAYNEAALKYHGEFAHLNDIKGT